MSGWSNLMGGGGMGMAEGEGGGGGAGGGGGDVSTVPVDAYTLARSSVLVIAVRIKILK